MSANDPQKKYFEIIVTCDYRIKGDELTPYLIYQNLDNEHKIYLTKDYDGIIFKADTQNSQKEFLFTGANISPTVNGSNIYPDLKISTVLENMVCIDDHQLNTNEETVGNITLFFILRNSELGFDTATGKMKIFLSSDPEVVNTGVVP